MKKKAPGEKIPAAAAHGGLWRPKDEADRAFTVFNSELFAERRKKLVDGGDLPWRILRYQRIIDPESASYPIANTAFVRPSSFEKQLRYLQEECTIVPLPQLLQQLDEGRPIAEGTVAITLDGGWIDSFAYAFPILRRLNVPATVFVPTAYIGTDDYLWPDKVMLAMLALREHGARFVPFSFFDAEALELVSEVSPGGEITLPLIFTVNTLLHAASPEDRWIATRTLGELVTIRGISPPAEPAFCSWEEISVMESSGVDIGTMGHRHLFFTSISPESAITDLRQSFAELSTRLRNPLAVFAAPEGDIAEIGYDAARELGVKCVLRLDDRPTATPPQGLPVLPRLPVYEGACYTTSLFACRVWGLG